MDVGKKRASDIDENKQEVCNKNVKRRLGKKIHHYMKGYRLICL